MKPILNVLLIAILALCLLPGCSSFGKYMKEMVGGKVTKKSRRASKKSVGKLPKNRKYRRTDHETLQQESKLGPNAGSLWIERGQGSYLFTQNTNRLIGDLVNVEIEGQAKKQIETKVNVIQNLLNRIMQQRAERRMALEKRQGKGEKRSPASKKGGAKAPASATKEPEQKFDIKVVPSQITEITKDGSYIVEGDQPFMIGKREYKLVVKGIVRQEDFDDEGISAETLLDPKFDIVTNRSKK
jgi:flagellar L-ring protein precursor FlgH